jgi:uncharacterized membrane protein
MEMKQLFMALIVTGAFVGIIAFMGNVGTNYGVSTTSNLTAIMKFNETSTRINSTYNQLTNTTTLFTGTILGQFIDPVAGFIMSSVEIFFEFFKIPRLLETMIVQASNSFTLAGLSIPGWFIDILIAIILLSVLIAFMQFLRGKSEF